MEKEELLEHFDKIIKIILSDRDFINYSAEELLAYLKEIYLKCYLQDPKDYDDFVFIEYLECLNYQLTKRGLVSIPKKVKLHEVIEQYRKETAKSYFAKIVSEFHEKTNLIMELIKNGTINDSQSDEESKAIVDRVFEDRKSSK